METSLKKPRPKESEISIELERIGTSPQIKSYQLEENVYLIAFRFRPLENVSGFNIPLKTRKIYYSQALDEEELHEINLEDFDFKEIYLPLPNGLISFSDRDFIVKNDEKIHLAAWIDEENMKLGFLVENSPQQPSFDWEFYYIRGDKEKH